MSKPLPKSLHTVTVLVRATYLVWEASHNAHLEPKRALAIAVESLGLADKPDTYGLIEAALKQLEK